MRKPFLLLSLLLGIFLNVSAQQTKDNLDLNTGLKSLKWRSIGPFRGGRSGAVTGVSGDIQTYYMGTTGGGLWKTSDMGMKWANISDGFFKTGSVGAVSVAESDPNVVYVGMGEHAVRGVMTHHGDGVYKSTDAGKTWKKMGLEETQHISRIIIHPKDPNTVYVAAQGALYSNSDQRGIYKSSDGGETWKKVLYINDKTGCADLSLDANNARIMYASMWEHGRLPWKVISGGAGSGLYKSTDGGENWNKMEEGLPKEMGKMAISVCRSNSEKVYALIESDSEKEAGGLFVSNDAGKEWSRVTNDHRLIQRAWYYIKLFVDPQNDQVVYVLSAPELKSIDGGKTWEEVSNTHGDYHDLWINPQNPRNRIIGDDGGAAVTINNGESWSTQQNMPTGQFYRINTDNQFPYRIYGGQQDYGSVSIEHRAMGGRNITTNNWTNSAGGESAFLAFDPDNPRFVLGGSYQGTIEVLDTKSQAATNIMAAPIQYLGMDAKDIKYRYNWNAPIVWSKHEPDTYYHGAQFVLRTSDMGKTWKEISPDLTRNEKEKQGKGGGPYTNEAVGAENYGTLAYILESPLEKGVIWTGSDDGLVHLTTDGGKNWKNVTPAGLSECLINAIEVSPHDKATAYIATTRYKFNDHTPGLYKTTDYGKSWKKIVNGIPKNAFTRVIREDLAQKDLLFAGTELGLYLSWNGGKDWSPFQLNLPIAPITDLKIHQGDLIAATSGRAFWILDDLGLIRQYKSNQTEPMLYQPENAFLSNSRSELDETKASFTGANPKQGVNPANGIVLYYHLDEATTKTPLTLDIKDAAGNLVRTISSVKDSTFAKWDGGPSEEPTLSMDKGLNRFVWNMRHPTMTGIRDAYFECSYGGHKAAPGVYTFTLRSGNKTLNTSGSILPNPLYTNTLSDYKEYHEVMLEMENNLREMHQSINTMMAKREQLAQLLPTLSTTDPKVQIIRTEGEALIATMKLWDEDMVQRKSKAYDDVENFPNKFTANYLFLINQTESDIPVVNQASLDLKKELDSQWRTLKSRAAGILETEIPGLNKKLWESGIGGIWKQ